MLTAARFQQHSRDLIDPTITHAARKDLITEIRDATELVHSQEYAAFLTYYLPSFQKILSTLTKPQFTDNIIHKTRALILEILNRLPRNEVLRPKLLEVFSMAMETLRTDNEDNAVTAIRIIFDLHKNYRNHLNTHVQPFLDFVRHAYESFGSTVQAMLSKKSQPNPSNSQNQQAPKQFAASSRSFKVITECPLLVMFVFQLYTALIEPNIHRLLPFMIAAIEYEVPQKAISPQLRTAFNEFISAQVKTVSFVAYLLKQYPRLLQNDDVSIPRGVVKLLQACPATLLATRRELLVATRHILNSRYRKGFFPQLDLLLDEKTLLGSDRPSADSLRPLAYSFLTDLIHNMRLNLTIPQLEKIIFLYSTNLHDPKFSYNLQTNAVRLLLNLMEGILKIDHSDTAKIVAACGLLIRILEALAAKYLTLGKQVPRLLASVENVRSAVDSEDSGRRLTDLPIGDPLKEVTEYKTLLRTVTLGLKTLVWSSLKLRSAHSTAALQATVPSGITPESSEAQQAFSTSSLMGNRVGLLEKECETVSLLVQAGVRCLRLYARSEKANGGSNPAFPSSKSGNGGDSSQKLQNLEKVVFDKAEDGPLKKRTVAVAATAEDENDIIDQFSQIFTILDPRSFQDIFGNRIAKLFDAIIDNPTLIAVPQHFLTDIKVCKYFADILLNFLIDHIQYLDVSFKDKESIGDVAKADTMLKLFKVLFASATVFPNNEPVLRLHIPSLVRKCITAAKTAKEPYRFLLVLRALFKYMASCKQEAKIDILFRDFGRMVEPLLNDLVFMYEGPNTPDNRNLIVELCLQIPAKPSTLFPCLQKQVKPMLWALQSETLSAGSSLKTLEFWIEILQPEYLEILLSPVEPDLTRALYKHLKPPENAHAIPALRILGKLGSKSRKPDTMVTPIQPRKYTGQTQKLMIKWLDGSDIFFETDSVISRATRILLGTEEFSGKQIPIVEKAHAWTLLFSCLVPYIRSKSEHNVMSVEKEKSSTEMVFPLYVSYDLSSLQNNLEPESSRKSKIEADGELHIVSTILTTLISSFRIKGLSDAVKSVWKSIEGTEYDSDRCLNEFCDHFAYITLQENEKLKQRYRIGNRSNQPTHNGKPGANSITHVVFIDSIISTISSEDQVRVKGGLDCLQRYFRCLLRYTSFDGTELLSSTKGLFQHQTSTKSTSSPSNSQLSGRGGTTPSQTTKTSEGEKEKMQVDLLPSQCKLSTDPKPGNSKTSEDVPPVNSTPKEKERDLQVLILCIGSLLDKLSHACYSCEWAGKESAVSGIRMIINMTPDEILRSTSFATQFIQLFRALIFLIREFGHSRKVHFIKGVKELLGSIIRTCFRLDENENRPRTMASNPRVVKEVSRSLIRELYAESHHAREAAKSSLKILAECLKRDQSDFLSATKDQLLRPFQQRPLRCLTVRQQIGHLDAINFCLELGKPLLPSDLLSYPLRENLLFEAVFRLEMLFLDAGTEVEERSRERTGDSRESGFGNQNVTLRNTILELLSNTVIHCGPSLKENTHSELVSAIITALFKTLQSRDVDVIQFAKKGLGQVISTHPDPKKLLMQHLRALLDNLKDFNKLTIPYLRRFSKVLELFSQYFSVTLGDKLLDHLQKWTKPEKLGHPERWTPGTESIVGAAILDLFHLLPCPSDKFVPKLIRLVIQLESALAVAGPGVAHLGLRSINGASISPYRKPLLHFCNKHASHANIYFLAHIEEEDTRQLFFALLQSEESTPMHADLVKSPGKFPSATFVSAQRGGQKSLHIATVMSILARSNAKWLGSDPDLMKRLISRWKIISTSQDAQRQSSATTTIVREIRTITETIILYCSQYPDDVKILFELLPVFMIRTTCDFTFVREFLNKAVTVSSTIKQRKAILSIFLSLFQDKTIAQEYKVYSLQQIIIPMITHHLEENGSRRKGPSVRDPTTKTHNPIHNRILTNDVQQQSRINPKNDEGRAKRQEDEVLDNNTVQRILKELLIDRNGGASTPNEQLSTELLRFVTVLIEYLPEEPKESEKQKTIWSQVISFGWHHLKREESISKHWAFVNVSTFLATFADQAPMKLILHVYIALLRAFQGDGRELVQQALDILIPAFRKKTTNNPNEHKYPIWIRYTKKILLEHGHAIPNLIHIWHLICRHPSLFFIARAQFVPAIVNSLQRIGLNQTASPENRRLAVDIVEVIINWELTRRESLTEHAYGQESSAVGQKRSRETVEHDSQVLSSDQSQKQDSKNLNQTVEPPAKTRKSSDAQPIPTAKSTGITKIRDVDDFRPSPNTIDHLVNFLVQVPFRPADHRERSTIVQRCVKLLEKALTLWPKAVIRFSFVEKYLSTIGNTNVASVAPHSNRNSTNNPSNASQADAARNSGQRNTKAEQIRQKLVIRSTATSTALSIAPVLVEKQGSHFMSGNINALGTMVAPALFENDASMATQFGSLLKRVFEMAPPKRNSLSDKSTTQEMSPHHRTGSPEQVTSAIVKPSQPVHAKDEAVPQGQIKSKQDDEGTKPLFVTVLRVINMCLKSGDVLKTHSGLIALQSLTCVTTEHFPMYQELLIKVLSRLAKEKITVPPSASLASQVTSGFVRNGSATNERNVGDNANQKQNRQAIAGQHTSLAVSMNTPEAIKVKQEQDEKIAADRYNNIRSLVLGLSMLSENILTLEASQRKALFQILNHLIDKSSEKEILLQIIKIVESWIFWKTSSQQVQATGQKEPLSVKDKNLFLSKMTSFERLSGEESYHVKLAYLRLILRIYGAEDPAEKRVELTPKLDRVFMIGLKSTDSPLYDNFFVIFNEAVTTSMSIRLNYIISKLDWDSMSDKFWISHASELLLASANESSTIEASPDGSQFTSVNPEWPELQIEGDSDQDHHSVQSITRVSKNGKEYIHDPFLASFYQKCSSVSTGLFTQSLRRLVRQHPEIAVDVWTSVVPKLWGRLNYQERLSMEKSFVLLLTKEYHQTQMTWPINCIQALLETATLCRPLPPIKSSLVAHLGARWNSWHIALAYFEARRVYLEEQKANGSQSNEKTRHMMITAELDNIANAQSKLLDLLHEEDYSLGIWKRNAKTKELRKGLVFQQTGSYTQAQDTFADVMLQQISSVSESAMVKQDQITQSQYLLCQDRWTECARTLCQWELLTEFSRDSNNSRLLHECLWRIPEWSGLREILIRDPIDEEPQLKLYQAYMHLQENKLDEADKYISQGFQKAIERFNSLPDIVDANEHGQVLVQFQQLVELQESSRIFTELNAVSRQSSVTVNIEQKIEQVRLTINIWRERLPSQNESLRVWSDILTWRNHVHAVIVNVLEALKEAASAKVAAAQGTGQATTANRQGNGIATQTANIQAAAAIAKALPQQVLVMGVNETAWNVHRFAKTCRQQGFADVSIFALQKLYPFGTMELGEYFVKTKEIARSFRDGPIGIDKGIESGLEELARCNMDHFNSRQKAQLFTLKAKLLFAAHREKEAVDTLYNALSISTDVGGTWLAWGQYCDEQHTKFLPTSLGGGHEPVRSQPSAEQSKSEDPEDLVWREASINCYMQAVRFGSRKARNYLPRVLRLLTIDSHRKHTLMLQKSSDSSNPNTDSPLNPLSKSIDQTGGSEKSNGVSPRDQNEAKVKTQQGSSAAKNSVSDVFMSLSNQIPGWMWITWLPQLLTMLARPEATYIRPILMNIAQRYPQAILIPLRAYMEERTQRNCPKEVKFRKAVQLTKQMTSFIQSPLAPSELSQHIRHSQATKDIFQRAKLKYSQTKAACDKEKSVLSTTTVGTPEHATHLAKHSQLENERSITEKQFHHASQKFNTAQQRSKQLSDSLQGVGLGYGGLLPGQLRGTESTNLNSQNVQNRVFPETASASSQQPWRLGDVRSMDNIRTKPEDRNADILRPTSLHVIDQKSNTSLSSFDHADLVMTQIVKHHFDLHQDVDRAVTELIIRMGWQREDQLFNLISVLLHRCYAYPSRPKPEILSSCRTALEEVSRRWFNTSHEPKAHNEQKVLTSISDLKESFEAELAPQTAKDFPTDMESLIVRLRRWRNILQRRVNALNRVVKLEAASSHLLELENTTIEVFGQYCKPLLSEPIVQHHVRIKRIRPDIHVIQRPSNPSKGISIIGSDGKTYSFLLESVTKTAIPSTEERTAQLSHLINSCIFSKDSAAYESRIKLAVPIFVTLGSRSRLVSHDFNLSVFSEGLEKHLEEQGKDFDDPVVKFRYLTNEYDKSRQQSGTEPKTRADVISGRIAAYRSLSTSEVPDSCFSRWVTSKMPNITSHFFFQKRFAQSLGTANLITYALAIGARRPQNLTFSWTTGIAQNLQMRSLISPDGTIANDEAVPFRLTRNILEFLGPHGVEGPFSGSMLVTLISLQKSVNTLKLFLEFVLRDELLAWSSAKADALVNRGSKGSEQFEIYHKIFSQVQRYLSNSIKAIMTRLQMDSNSISEIPKTMNQYDIGTSAIHDHIEKLIEKATKAENLAQMDANWHAWY